MHYRISHMQGGRISYMNAVDCINAMPNLHTLRLHNVELVGPRGLQGFCSAQHLTSLHIRETTLDLDEDCLFVGGVPRVFTTVSYAEFVECEGVDLTEVAFMLDNVSTLVLVGTDWRDMAVMPSVQHLVGCGIDFDLDVDSVNELANAFPGLQTLAFPSTDVYSGDGLLTQFSQLKQVIVRSLELMNNHRVEPYAGPLKSLHLMWAGCTTISRLPSGILFDLGGVDMDDVDMDDDDDVDMDDDADVGGAVAVLSNLQGSTLPRCWITGGAALSDEEVRSIPVAVSAVAGPRVLGIGLSAEEYDLDEEFLELVSQFGEFVHHVDIWAYYVEGDVLGAFASYLMSFLFLPLLETLTVEAGESTFVATITAGEEGKRVERVVVEPELSVRELPRLREMLDEENIEHGL